MENSRYIYNIKVVFTDDRSKAPSNRVLEHDRKDENINYEFGGRNWHADHSQHNLAEGAGGEYEYRCLIHAGSAMQTANLVTDVALLRSEFEADEPPAGWNGMASNVNKGRDKSHLYFMWKTAA